jgi:hypothetical protein
VRPPRTHLVAQHLAEAYAAVLLGFVILAALIRAVVSAREVARRAFCGNNVRQHSGCYPDTVRRLVPSLSDAVSTRIHHAARL